MSSAVDRNSINQDDWVVLKFFDSGVKTAEQEALKGNSACGLDTPLSKNCCIKLGSLVARVEEF
jgi:hypothetical protein